MSDNCEEISPLEKLPSKVLQEISAYLSCTEFKRLSETSKLINKLISEDPLLLRKLPLVLTSDNTKNFQDARSALTRRYSEVHIEELKFNKNIALWLTSNYCSKLQVLVFFEVDFNVNDYKLLRKVLQSLHHLERLLFFGCDFITNNSSLISDIEPVEMINLQRMHLLESSVQFLLFIKTPNLKCLKIASPNESFDIIVLFLSCQSLKKLQQLALWNIELHQEVIQSIRIPLRNLSLRNLNVPTEKKNHFIGFLDNCADTTEELEIGAFESAMSKDVYLHIFSKFLKLKTLRLSIKKAPKGNHFYERELVFNTSITKLIINTSADSKISKQLSGFLSKLPNLETLILPCEIDKGILVVLMKNCMKLKKLKVNGIEIPKKAFGNIFLPSITELRLCTLKSFNTKKCGKLVKAFPNLEGLEIHNCDKSTTSEGVMNILTTKLDELKHVTLGAGFKANERIFNQLAQFKELKSVEILQQAFKDSEIATKIKNEFQKEGLQFICYSGDGMCDRLDNIYGCKFWKAYSILDGQSEDEGLMGPDDLLNKVAGFMFQMILRNNAYNDDSDDSDEDSSSSEEELIDGNQNKKENLASSVLAEELD